MPSLLVVHAVDGPGGADLALLRAAPALLRRGWRITMTGPTGRRPAEAPDGVVWRAQPVGGPGRGRGAAALAGYGAFRALAAGHDVVHLDGAVPARLLPALRGTGLVAAAALRGGRLRRHAERGPAGPLGARSVVHVHDVIGRVPASWAQADALLADSAACAAPVAAALGRDVTVTGRPIDPDPAPVDPPWTPDGRPVVAFLGPIARRKGPLDLVSAAEGVRIAVPRVRVVVIGDDPPDADADYTRLVDRRAEATGVERWGRQPGGAGLLRHVDVLVVPSEREPFGTVAAEALALGVPVVASAVDGLVEVVRDGVTGRLIPPHDPQALAHGVIWALRNGPLMTDACRTSAERWHVEAYAQRLHDVYTAPVPPAAPAADPASDADAPVQRAAPEPPGA
ncbi:glycosyltransferase [Patulibacter americanus]|uniref:glycosyltransferase n=1 Tax=Patulibacter americanus TaxID=588672 RepID=UPI0003B3C832|nr:glycosyltransferase [Patulibacter americanus]